MRVEVVEKFMLKDIMDVDAIHSVILIQHDTFRDVRKSLAISVETDRCRRSLPNYAQSTPHVGCYFISLDKFTYTFPYYLALPREYYNNIQIIKYRVYGGDIAYEGHEYLRARILKKVIF